MSQLFTGSNLLFASGYGMLWWRHFIRARKSVRNINTVFPPKQESNHISWQHLADQLAIIVPARNEEKNLSTLLKSLYPLKKIGTTIIVVDDQSTDRTHDIARELGFEVIKSSSKPEGWSGKNWACHQGAHHLNQIHFSGKYILFTDADTSHHPEHYPKALSWFSQHSAALMTCRPYHRNPTAWEKALGPFYSMIQLITDSKQTLPSKERFFSIGQFLLFDKDYYWASEGHLKIKNVLAEDLALAKECFSRGQTFLVYPLTDLYSTRMYATPQEFFSGWQRNFRLGMKYSSPKTWIETILVVGATLGHWTWIHYALLTLFFVRDQRDNGRFSTIGAFLYPINMGLFIFISLCARVSNSLKLGLRWKARRYSTDT
jgi:cellulose synthase/poly-beta-1,6-N-acetylglucosamine synthase-like glycosyltransferase